MRTRKLSLDQHWLAEALDALSEQDTERLDRLGCPPAEGPRRRLWLASKEVSTTFALFWQDYHKRHSILRSIILFGDSKARPKELRKELRGRLKAVGGTELPGWVYQRLLDSLLDLRGIYRGLATFCKEVSLDPQNLLAWVKPYVSEVGRGPGSEREMLGLDDDTQPLNLDLGYKTYSLFVNAWAAMSRQPARQ